MNAETLKKTVTLSKNIGDVGCIIFNILAVIVLLSLSLPVVCYVRNVEGHSLKNREEKKDQYKDSMDESAFSLSSGKRSGISLVIEF